MDKNIDEQKLREEIEKEIRSKMTIWEKIRGILFDFLTLIFLFLAIWGLISIIGTYIKKDKNIVPKTDQENLISTSSTSVIENSKPNDEQLSDLDKFNSYNKVSIYPDGIITPSDYIKNDRKSLENAGRKIIVKGKISDAFIYIKAGATDSNGKFSSVLKNYDGIWFYLMNGSFIGGQLDLSRSTFGQISELTELLYNLKNVPLAKNNEEYRKNSYQIKDLISELQGERIVGAMVSTQRYGKIEQLVIGYKCGDGSVCKIDVK